jgi:ABC-type branched-subunit amino acid transport system ATPase component
MDLIAERDGTVRFNGSDISRLKPYEIARLRLGFAPEDRRIFADLTVLENLDIGRQPPRTFRDGIDAAAIKGVVDRLGLRGFVTTGSDTKDRRRRAVALTEKGSRIMEAAIKVASEITAKTLKPLSAEEQRTVIRLLKRLT